MLLPPPGEQEGGKAVKPAVHGPPGLPMETPALSRNRWQEDLCKAVFPQGAVPPAATAGLTPAPAPGAGRSWEARAGSKVPRGG